MIVYLDMDDVSVDFTGGVEKIIGKPYTPVNDWNIHEHYKMSENDFWNQSFLNSNSFFKELEPLPGFFKFYNFIKTEITEELYFCTKPTRSPECVKGKLEWIQKYFGKEFKNYIFISKKYLLANGKNTILIDDAYHNIESFNLHGGTGITFPQLWNKHPQAKESSQVKYAAIKRTLIDINKTKKICNK